ncbi:F0F1 ATP synthase subunit B [Rhizobium binae]|uniref:F0F1 ATP synthase subunit B n=1 Tax=Rhizobium binae TaxID=1138190 RepID=UPI001C82F909|nr:F0F1 ATP synthase subunit B [Rhizobium binae]MBX4939912.1 F0F1 ATP synthase subunit B [Rhizobium binae]MBX4946431.1 F0F1 ATP synthase subunit B [Rhizobium binae]MBX4981896.1 F0F1 ATP synthase subunit B [Rhizobium binae]
MFFVTPAYAEEAPAAATGTDAHAAPAAGEVHTETGVAEGEHARGPFPPFDSTTYASQLLWLVITFSVFYLLIQKVIAPRIGAILDQRHTRISQDLDEAGRLKAEADAAVRTYEGELAAARAKSNAIASAARDAAKARAEEDRRAVEASLSEKIKAAEVRIADIKAKAFADVGTIAEETAAAVVEQLIGGTAAQADVAAAVAAAKKEA